MSRALEDVDAEPSDDEPSDEDPSADEEEQQRIADARALAYANRAARQQRAEALDFAPISSGCIFTTTTYFPDTLVARLRADALALERAGEFAASGLSDAARGRTQGFGDADRIVRVITANLGGDRDARREFQQHLDALRCAAGAALGRSLICAEQYYSIQRTGASLPRHMDEKHEELKGTRGWRTSHRRSLSWLLYLSDEQTGGSLRGYCRHATGGCGVGAHEGNLQVGWLATAEEASDDAEPVFMDGWVQGLDPLAAGCDGSHSAGSRPMCALYRVGRDGERDWLSAGFDFVAMRSQVSEDAGEGGPTDPGRVLAMQLPQLLRSRFSTVEAVPHEGGPPARLIDMSPVGGRLVIFDAVSVPHEVGPTTSGERVAMAGWFHEPQRPFPAWFNVHSAPERGEGPCTLPPVVAQNGGPRTGT